MGGTDAGAGGMGDGGAGTGGGGTVREAPVGASLAVDQYNVCAIVNRVIRCWGGSQALGDGRTPRQGVPVAVPVTVADITDAVDIGIGIDFACALRANKTVWCWGEGGYGQLGDGIIHRDATGVAVAVARPQPVPGITDAIDVSVGSTHACALLENGHVECWGSDRVGQLGDEDPHATEPFVSATPVEALGITNAVQLSVRGNQSCARLADQTVVCWGVPGATTAADPTPTQVSGAVGYESLDTADNHSCLLDSNGGVSCWGNNTFNELGTGDGMPRWQPTLVNGVAGVIQVTGGLFHTCALLSDRTARCWGLGDVGQLGDGNEHPIVTSAIVPVNLTGIDEIVGGHEKTCARVGQSRVFCWGDGTLATLGNENLRQSLSPVEIDGVAP
jgi:alpha-tubulin suppressor-like RCC1 family protein